MAIAPSLEQTTQKEHTRLSLVNEQEDAERQALIDKESADLGVDNGLQLSASQAKIDAAQTYRQKEREIVLTHATGTVSRAVAYVLQSIGLGHLYSSERVAKRAGEHADAAVSNLEKDVNRLSRDRDRIVQEIDTMRTERDRLYNLANSIDAQIEVEKKQKQPEMQTKYDELRQLPYDAKTEAQLVILRAKGRKSVNYVEKLEERKMNVVFKTQAVESKIQAAVEQKESLQYRLDQAKDSKYGVQAKIGRSAYQARDVGEAAKEAQHYDAAKKAQERYTRVVEQINGNNVSFMAQITTPRQGDNGSTPPINPALIEAQQNMEDMKQTMAERKSGYASDFETRRLTAKGPDSLFN